jgi:ER membrane protein complex subunit 2
MSSFKPLMIFVVVFGSYENIFTAALDHGDYDTADKYLRILVDRFPQSSRVKRLLGMAQEAQGDFSGALKIYDEILTETPTNLLVLKRKVSPFHLSPLTPSI